MYRLIKTNLARNSLRYIIRCYGITELYIPYYLCKVIRQSVIKEGCKPVFYHIDDNFFPTIDLPENSFILYPNYFGICDLNTDILSKKYSKLIVDNAHSFYATPKGFACFNSARKFLPVANGSFLWIKDEKIKLEKEEFPQKLPTNESELQLSEAIFNDEDIKGLNDITAKKIDSINNNIDRIKIFEKLHQKYKSTNLLSITSIPESPFCYPYLAQSALDADNIVKEYSDKNITIYRYWDKLPKDYNEYKFFERLVPIPLK